MNPAQAGQLDLGEPNWLESYKNYLHQWSELLPHLQEENAYEATLKDWRRFYATPIKDSTKRTPAPAVDGIIALANLGVFAPRTIPRDGMTGYQLDEHMWLSIKGEQWRITGIEDRTMHLQRMFGEETMQIDLNRADWTKYNEAALRMLKGRNPDEDAD